MKRNRYAKYKCSYYYYSSPGWWINLKLWFEANGDYSIGRPRIYERKEKIINFISKNLSRIYFTRDLRCDAGWNNPRIPEIEPLLLLLI